MANRAASIDMKRDLAPIDLERDVREAHNGQTPVVLATLSVPVDPEAERVALEAASEVGSRLILANMLSIRPGVLTITLARDCVNLPHEEALDEVRATAARAAAAGIPTELLRISSLRPVESLLELTTERGAGLLVFGPDRSQLPRWRYRKATRAIRRNAPCLVWIAPHA